MSRCPNCGASFENNKCSYCGTKNPDAPKQGTMGSFVESIMETINSNIQNYSQNGIPSSAKPNQYFLDNFMKEHKAFNEKSEEEKNAIREKNRLARVAISNGKCPECSTPFKANNGFALSASCKKCGASIYEVTYIDKF